MMIRGTTPTICFHLPFEYDSIEEMWLTIAQRGKDVITKTKEEMEYDNGTFCTKLSQAETLRLVSGQKTEMQVRVRFTSGDAIASTAERVDVDEILRDGEI